MSKQITIRPMQAVDLPFADRVRHLAGWNQTDRDWRRLLEYQRDGCFVAFWQGRPAGTATAVCYGNLLGWIGMVLVHPELRRRGIATALMHHCIEFLEARVACIKLDATPDGQKVYERLDFQAEHRLTRWQHMGPPLVGPEIKSGQLEPSDWPIVARRDAEIFGARRESWLRILARDSLATLVLRDSRSEIAAYGMARRGARAGYLGPVIAFSNLSPAPLIEGLLQQTDQDAVYWDIPDDNTEAVQLARELGFTKQRPLVRMWHGARPNACILDRQWAIADLSTG